MHHLRKMVLFLLACSGPVSSPPLTDSGDSPVGGDSASPSLGDPITTRSEYRPQGFWEFLDAGFDSRGRALYIGVGGLLVVDPESGQELFRDESLPMANRIVVEGDTAWVGGRTMEATKLSLGESSASWVEHRLEAPALDLDVQDGLLYLASGHLGLQVREEGELLGSFSGQRGSCIAVDGERALLVDQNELVLLDISTPSAISELDRLALGLPGRDLVLEGQRGAVGLGSSGVQLLSIEGDRITLGQVLETPGSALRLALDGEELWIAAWEVSALAHWPEGGEAVIVGHELPTQSAMGVAAQDGTAAIAGWFDAALLDSTGMRGSELHLPEEIQLDPGTSRALRVRNWGSEPLELELGGQELQLEGGDEGLLSLELSGEAPETLAWTSNDPDEPSGSLKLAPTHEILGTEHPDFTLEGFVGMNGETSTTTLSDHRGELVLLAYWTTW